MGSMTYAPTTNAPARNANVEAYINPDPNPNPNPNSYPALNQKPNHTHESIKLCLRRGINAVAIVAGAYVVSPSHAGVAIVTSHWGKIQQ